MQKIVLIDETGKERDGYIDMVDGNSAENSASTKSNLKEHLYLTYLIFGTLAFAFGIYISVRRLKANK